MHRLDMLESTDIVSYFRFLALSIPVFLFLFNNEKLLKSWVCYECMRLP
uniref:Uncharacterized protein n=1 Tax=Arundo donax TaxID=35708 RepID=A0A0A9GP90_ARUDO